MCILCVIQKWSRRVATMLPWLVIPLIGFWALSQLLPPAFRFEITSPKLACVFVLLVTLFWYEILMPHLSAWRVRRNAQLRERKRTEAIEFQKLRKTATRKCRNCSTPYRDQNPGGGRFMCSYCGHISKRPVLDLPLPPGLEISNPALVKDFVGNSGKMLTGKAWSENGWICSPDWLENNSRGSRPAAGKSSYWRKNGDSLFEVDDDCLAEKSYSGLVIFACKLLTSFLMSIRWLCRKIFSFSSSKEVNSSDADHRALLAKRGENGVNFNESRGEKARRKAEEKRQARLEKELEEEEERKQREEVARLVDERRKLRDEILEAERSRSKSSPPAREKERKREAERKRQERRKDKDKGSSKSNSDAEEFDKKASKESERKWGFEKKYECERQDLHKPGMESVKGQNFDQGHVVKNTSSRIFGHGNPGNRYLDRMRGTFLSSSRAFGGTGFFGRTASAPLVVKDNKFTNSVDHAHNSSFRKDICPPERIAGKLSVQGDDKNVNRPVILDPQPSLQPKKSWQQLFTRGAAAGTPAKSNVISRPNPKIQVDGNSPQRPGQPPVMQSFDNPINFGLPSPFTLPPHPSIPESGNVGLSPQAEPIFHHFADRPCEIVPEEPELFEDPCYIPNPMSLLGPVSESLDNFGPDPRMDRPHAMNNLSVCPEATKPSPIESPLTRIRVNNENRNSTSGFSTTTKAQNMHALLGEDANFSQTGTWQMWNSSPLGQDGPCLGLVGVAGSWLLPEEWNKSTKEDSLQPSSKKTMASLFSKDDQVVSGTQSPLKSSVGNGLNGGVCSPSAGSSLVEPWLQKASFPPLSGGNSHFPLSVQDESSQNEMIHGSPTGAAVNHLFESSPVNRWPEKEMDVQGSGERFANLAGSSSPPAPVQSSLWSFNR